MPVESFPARWMAFAALVLFSLPCGASSAPQQSKGPEGDTWIDPSTNLMWAAHDNGADVNWEEASTYCQNLRLAGFSDWRLGSINALEDLDDPSSTRTFTFRSSTYPYHIKGGITLTGWEWSATEWGTNSFGKSNYHYNFSRGEKDTYPVAQSDGHRALCVRSSDAPVANSAKKALVALTVDATNGNVVAMQTLGYVYFFGQGDVQKNVKEADKWLQRAAAGGSVLSNLLLARMYENGWGVTRDVQWSHGFYAAVMESKDTSPELKKHLQPEWDQVQKELQAEHEATSRVDYTDANGVFHKAGIAPLSGPTNKRYVELAEMAISAVATLAVLSAITSAPSPNGKPAVPHYGFHMETRCHPYLGYANNRVYTINNCYPESVPD
jgi:hypothetical protein